MILRDRDNTNYLGSAGGTLGERRYYSQNWRSDVAAIVTDTGEVSEWCKYSAYGVPISIPAGDLDTSYSVTSGGGSDVAKNVGNFGAWNYACPCSAWQNDVTKEYINNCGSGNGSPDAPGSSYEN